MPKTPKKKKAAPRTKARRAKTPTIRIKIEEVKGTAQDFEQEIAAKLDTEPTSLFRDHRKIIIVIEKFGGRPE